MIVPEKKRKRLGVRVVGAIGVAISVACCLAYGTLVGASRVYVSSSSTIEDGTYFRWQNFVWDAVGKVDSRLLPRPQVSRVGKLSVLHAIRNAIYLASSLGLALLLPLLAVPVGILGAVWGVLTGDWEKLLVGALGFPLLAVLATGTALLGAFVVYGMLLFQACTPAYAVVWIALILPIVGAALSIGAAPVVTVIVIVRSSGL